MVDPVFPYLVPYRDANAQTREDFLDGLRRLYELDGNPEAWRCTVCGETTAGDDVLITYNVPTPIQVCPAKGKPCLGNGPQLVPASAA